MFKRTPKPYRDEYDFNADSDLPNLTKLKRFVKWAAIIIACVVSGFLLALHFIPQL
jgi:hypothetical protein